MGEYMWVCVKLDITKLLVQKRKLKLGLPDLVWIGFSYERFQEFYFYCEIVGHSLSECEKQPNYKAQFKEETLPYGSWLRVGRQKISSDNHKLEDYHPNQTPSSSRNQEQWSSPKTGSENLMPKVQPPIKDTSALSPSKVSSRVSTNTSMKVDFQSVVMEGAPTQNQEGETTNGLAKNGNDERNTSMSESLPSNDITKQWLMGLGP